MRQAFFRDAKAKYNDIVFWSKPSDWKNQTTTPNSSTLYVYFNFNTKDGPVVLIIPPSVEAGLFGSLLDAWHAASPVLSAAGNLISYSSETAGFATLSKAAHHVRRMR